MQLIITVVSKRFLILKSPEIAIQVLAITPQLQVLVRRFSDQDASKLF